MIFISPEQFFRDNWNRFIPSPERLPSFASSMVIAAAIGGGYGLIGRVVYPRAGISPLNYAIWFATAYQIKECFHFAEKYLEGFLGVGAYLEKLEKIPEDQLDLQDQIRYHSWKMINLKNNFLKKLDQIASHILGIRPSQEINEKNVEKASFLEMCRYRVWRVFKETILDTISSSLAYHLTGGMGFTLPSRTAVPLFIIMRSIVKDILLVPALYVYANFCNQLANELGDKDERAAAFREACIRYILPTL